MCSTCMDTMLKWFVIRWISGTPHVMGGGGYITDLPGRAKYNPDCAGPGVLTWGSRNEALQFLVTKDALWASQCEIEAVWSAK